MLVDVHFFYPESKKYLIHKEKAFFYKYVGKPDTHIEEKVGERLLLAYKEESIKLYIMLTMI